MVYSSSVEVYQIVGHFYSAYFFNILLVVLQILHILWSFMIFKIIMQKFTEGEVCKEDTESCQGQEKLLLLLIETENRLNINIKLFSSQIKNIKIN